ncbi:LytTR family DNA-binding domain-containing protein [Terrimonas sp. NA20]|uniref:LytTR family DNA-binding domain-containing protein n=1 Tax=Terrimonas ginsenosidimutans TaxID=2908004 RepID=A0ABS9KZG3_9BACT|nr:LytTR family DNA-binding domain-containing protein [Terrimonas ginsenosidimutans]MCG2617736.1 LytTR family DNA-binding domain-containing protein [Terrimonas ginsenosidimutans]
MKITCIIVDDEPNGVKLLSEYAASISALEVKAHCSNSKQALEAIEQYNPDIAFLDINMPGISGIDLAAQINGNTGIIFTTAYAEYAVISYDYNAIDYLLKPISLNRFKTSVEKAIAFLQNRKLRTEETPATPQYFFIKTGQEMLKIDFTEVIYVEASKEYAILHTAQSKHFYYRRMKELALLLPANFIRIHHSYIVNLNFITKIETQQVCIGDHYFPVSATYKKDLFRAIKGSTI